MLEIRRILFPTDFSEYSEHALRYAWELVEKFGSQLHLLNVVSDLASLVPEPGLGFVPPPQLQGQLLADARSRLDSVPGIHLPNRDVVQETRIGTAFLEIIRYARNNQIDLIVLGTHGHTGLKHVLLGSVAERVVRKAPCPVLTVRHPDHSFEMP